MDNEGRYIHDAYIARGERTEKRLWIIVLILIALLAVTNAAWVYYESQFEEIVTTTIEAEQDGEGVNIVSGGDALNVPENQNNHN